MHQSVIKLLPGHCKKLVFEAFFFFFFLNYESILTPIGRKLISSLPQRISEVMKNKGQEFTPISKVFETYIVVVVFLCLRNMLKIYIIKTEAAKCMKHKQVTVSKFTMI